MKQMERPLDRAVALWHCYFHLLEVHDRQVCTGPEGTPAVAEEMELVGQHAERARLVLYSVAEEVGVMKSELDVVRKSASRCGPDTNKEEAERSGLLPLFMKHHR